MEIEDEFLGEGSLIFKNINMKKVIWMLLPCLLIFLSNVNSLTIYTFKWVIWGDIDSNDPPMIEWQRSIFNIISLVNKYLWFTIGLACFWFMIWNGYQLIMARGDEKQMKSATNALIGCAVWLTVCILAHIIVNLAVKLFA